MLSPNIDRWIFASISKHFDDNKGSMTLYVEGMIRKTNTIEEFIELRMDGPNSTEISHKYWHLFMEVNVLVQCAKNHQNFHRMRQMTGQVYEIFEPCINVYRYGSGIDDDSTLVGVLRRVDNIRDREAIKTSHFGQIEPRLELEQATVEAHYEMDLEE